MLKYFWVPALAMGCFVLRFNLRYGKSCIKYPKVFRKLSECDARNDEKNYFSLAPKNYYKILQVTVAKTC